MADVGKFDLTTNLKTINFWEAMASPHKAEWLKAVKDKHLNFVNYKVWEPVDAASVPADAKILLSPWAMQQKANGQFQAHLTDCGYKQVDGLHYSEDNKAAPVVCDITVCIILTLSMMAGWIWILLDIQWAFLNGHFSHNKHLYMCIPQGFKCFYIPNVLLLLLQTIYGLKQVALQFWREI